MKTQLYNIINNLEEMSPLPETAIKIAQILNDPLGDTNDIVNIIEHDPIVTADILRMANSVLYASRTEITSIKQATVRLGGARILNHLIGKKTKSILSSKMNYYGYSESDLWKHSVASSLAAQELSNYYSDPIDGAAYTAALLHDIGKIIIIRTLNKEQLIDILSLVSKGTSYEQAENDILGFSHADAGAALIEKWGLPESIVNAVADHHKSTPSDSQVTNIVRLSNIISHVIGEGLGYEGMNIDVDLSIIEVFHLKKASFELLCMDTKLKLAETLSDFE